MPSSPAALPDAFAEGAAPPAETRTLSLRALFVLGGAGMAVVLLLGVAFFHRAAGSVAEQRGALAAYHDGLDDLVHAYAAEVLAADVALRQAREIGGAVSVPALAESVSAIAASMRPEDLAGVAGLVAELSRASLAWREAAHAASDIAAGPDALAALRERDEAVVAAAAELRRALAVRERSAAASLAARTSLGAGLGLAAAALAAVAGGLFLALVHRHTVRPLTALARHTEAALPVPDERQLRVTEVRRLGRALRRLQTQVQERQQSLEQSRARAVQLSRFAELVQGTGKPHEIRTAVANMLEGVLPDGAVQIVEWDGSRTRLQQTWPQTAGGAVDAALDGTTCPAIRRKRPVRGEAASETACDCAFGASEAGTYACVPMLSAGAVAGLVNIQTRRPAAWTRADVAGAQAYVNFASSALGTIYVLESTQDRALRDGLTGAYNRRFLDEYLVERFADTLRHHQPLSVLLFDLDHFKLLNDSFGHAIGDRALVEFARMVQGQIRAADAFVRHGGEEFVLVLSSTDVEGAMIVADRIRARAERIVLEAPAGCAAVPRVTASIGVATVGVHGSSVSELLAAADRAVYRAKARGRNRVELAEPVAEADPEHLVSGH